MRGVVACLGLAAAMVSLPVYAEEPAKAAVADGKVVAIEYTLRLEDGKLVATNVGETPLVLVQGRGEVFPGLERAIAGMAPGETKQGTLAAAEAYGEVAPELFVEVESARIPEPDRHVGAQVFFRDESGARRVVRIHEVRGDRVTVDLNHALAGNPIRYEVRVLRVEDAPR